MSTQNPMNEQETIYNFILRMDYLGVSIKDFYSCYPDAKMVDWKGVEYKIEFEYKLSSFIKHGHDPRSCDLVVCWTNDLKKIEFPITVWELKNHKYPEIERPDSSKLDILCKIIKDKSQPKPIKFYESSAPNVFDGILNKLRNK